ncbi:hypothetical protein [Microbacterium sp. 4-7]|uniref:hypothetical protein n=1 Tax=Microbacterium sp. 4-7 TaxID=1885327 RepID=UPI00164FD384|nr:hypothetical protein [Microbacterium sp. 4-7]MBC6493545.1 hypothetical protein [Microbacterium sp. 4-7]
MSFLKTRVLLWPVLLLIALCAAIGVLGVTLAGSIPSMFSAESDERNTQVVQAVTREEQIVLVGLGIEGIAEKKQNETFFGIFVPGTDRAKFLRYSLEAKLGIDGKDVLIEETGENSFRVTIPEFIFIGSDDFEYEVAVDKDGPLSWTTPGIEESEMVNNIMNDEFEASHLESNRELLMDQARSFYGGIIKSIDDDTEVEFRFEGGATQTD